MAEDGNGIGNAGKVEVTVLFFAKSRDLTGTKEVNLQIQSELNASCLLNIIIEKFPRLAAIRDSIVLCINQEYISGDSSYHLSPGDEVAVIPPLSGEAGRRHFNMDDVKLTTGILSVERAVQTVTDPSCGAVSMFLGTTRDNFDGKKVVRLEYEAYESMAEKQLDKLCLEMRQKWDLHNILIHHRLGLVPVTESSVMIVISSAHRKESLEAVQYCIDQLKATVPIWKKEIYDEGDGCWKANKECSWASKS